MLGLEHLVPLVDALRINVSIDLFLTIIYINGTLIEKAFRNEGLFCVIYTYSAKSISNEAQQIIVLKIAHRLKKYFRHHKL